MVDDPVEGARTGDRRTAAIAAELRGTDRRSMGPLLDELAAQARHDESAAALLLSAIVEHGLAEVSIRKFFFDQDDVDDGVQNTVLAVAAGINGFRGEASFLTWLDRVASNVALQMKRRGSRLSEPVTNEVPETPALARRLSSIVADEIVISRALVGLSDDHQVILRLREIEGRSYDEIAGLLGVAVGTVRSRLSRARSDLAELIVADIRGRQ